jgi:hypothetical protein
MSVRHGKASLAASTGRCEGRASWHGKRRPVSKKRYRQNRPGQKGWVQAGSTAGQVDFGRQTGAGDQSQLSGYVYVRDERRETWDIAKGK